MKKLFVILLLALFAVGVSSCAEESLDTEPVIPEVNQEVMDQLQDQKSTTAKRRVRQKSKTIRKQGG